MNFQQNYGIQQRQEHRHVANRQNNMIQVNKQNVGNYYPVSAQQNQYQGYYNSNQRPIQSSIPVQNNQLINQQTNQHFLNQQQSYMLQQQNQTREIQSQLAKNYIEIEDEESDSEELNNNLRKFQAFRQQGNMLNCSDESDDDDEEEDIDDDDDDDIDEDDDDIEDIKDINNLNRQNINNATIKKGIYYQGDDESDYNYEVCNDDISESDLIKQRKQLMNSLINQEHIIQGKQQQLRLLNQNNNTSNRININNDNLKLLSQSAKLSNFKQQKITDFCQNKQQSRQWQYDQLFSQKLLPQQNHSSLTQSNQLHQQSQQNQLLEQPKLQQQQQNHFSQQGQLNSQNKVNPYLSQQYQKPVLNQVDERNKLLLNDDWEKQGKLIGQFKNHQMDNRNQYQQNMKQLYQMSQYQMQNHTQPIQQKIRFMDKKQESSEECDYMLQGRVDSEVSTDDDYFSQIESIKLSFERNPCRFSKTEFDTQINQNRDEIIEQIGRLVREQKMEGVKIEVMKKEMMKSEMIQEDKCQIKFLEEELLKNKTKEYRQKLKRLQDKQQKLKTLSAVSIISKLRKYEEDGVFYQDKQFILEKFKKQDKFKPAQETIFESEIPIKKLKTDDSFLSMSNDKSYEDRNLFNDAISQVQIEKQNSKHNIKDEDEGDDDSAQNNFNQLNKNKKQKIKLICYCKENREDEMVLCDNKKCELQWFHIKCLQKRYQIRKELNGNKEEFSMPKENDEEWYCYECLLCKTLIQKRSKKHRKSLMKQKNKLYYMSIGREDLFDQKYNSKKKKSLTTITSSILGSENSMGLLKSENSCSIPFSKINTYQSLKQLDFGNRLNGSDQKNNQDNKTPQKNSQECTNNLQIQQSPNSQKKEILDKKSSEKKDNLDKKENSENKLQSLLNKYLNDDNEQQSQQCQNSNDRIFEKSPLQSSAKKDSKQQSPINSSKQNENKINTPSISNQFQISPQPQFDQKHEFEDTINQDANGNIGYKQQQQSNSQLNDINSVKFNMEIEENKCPDQTQFNYKKENNKNDIHETEQNNKQDINEVNQQQDMIEECKQQDILQKMKSEEEVTQNVIDQEMPIFNLKDFHQNLIFHCLVKDEFSIKQKRKNIKVTDQSKIIAFIQKNSFFIDLYVYNPDKRPLQSIFSSRISNEKEYYVIEHVVFKGNSYIVFSHPNSVSIFSVYKTHVYKVNIKLQKYQQFYLSSNDKCIQLFTKTNKPEELKCYNITILDKRAQLEEETFFLDDKCQNFQQLCFFKDTNDETNFVFLSQDRMTIYLYPDLVSDKPIRSIEAEYPFKQIQLTDPTQKRLVMMDQKNQILQYEIDEVLEYCNNKCVYQDNYSCIKYFVQPNHNILLQLYDEQIHLSGLDSSSLLPKAVSLGKVFLDAIYLELDQEIILFYLEQEQSEEKQGLSYFIINK